MKVKVKDKVIVLAGKYKGKTGLVMRIFKKANRLTVEKINIRTKHVKKTSTRAGQIIKYEAPFDASNVMVLCPNCNKPTRVGYNIPEKKSTKKGAVAGKKYRICKKCGESIEHAVSIADKKKK